VSVNRRFTQVAILILIGIAVALPAQTPAFTNASLKGSFSFLTSLETANPSTNQFAMVGVLTFDGAGHVTGSFTSISHDAVATGALGGTYAVNSNGSGSITFTTGSTAQFAITLNSTAAGLAHGLQMLQINDSNNEIISGTAVLQSTTTATYSLASLKGPFTLQYTPHTADGTLAEDGGVAVFTFDGKGGIMGSETTVFDGAVFTGSSPFTYTLKSDGTGTVSPTVKGPHIAFALNTVAGGLAKGLQFLDTNTSDGTGNLVITGSALKR
jgi:hypothetical protein